MRTTKWVSSYYPPRARWYAPILGFGEVIRRQRAFERIRLPAGISFWGFFGGLFVPGLAFYVRGSRLLGRAAVAGCVVLISVFVLWLGYPVATWSFGLLLSIHASGIILLIEPWLDGAALRHRLLLTLVILVSLGGLIYVPARGFVEDHWLMPLRMNGRVFVVRRTAAARAVHRGDWIAYSLSEREIGPHMYVRAGFGLGPVFAMPGEGVRFTETTFEVNGLARPRLPSMPSAGELVVPERHWFVWPDFAIGGHGYAPGSGLPDTLLQMAMISEEQLIGKPCKRWFWRRQLTS